MVAISWYWPFTASRLPIASSFSTSSWRAFSSVDCSASLTFTSSSASAARVSFSSSSPAFSPGSSASTSASARARSRRSASLKERCCSSCDADPRRRLPGVAPAPVPPAAARGGPADTGADRAGAAPRPAAPSAPLPPRAAGWTGGLAARRRRAPAERLLLQLEDGPEVLELLVEGDPRGGRGSGGSWKGSPEGRGTAGGNLGDGDQAPGARRGGGWLGRGGGRLVPGGSPREAVGVPPAGGAGGLAGRGERQPEPSGRAVHRRKSEKS